VEDEKESTVLSCPKTPVTVRKTKLDQQVNLGFPLHANSNRKRTGVLLSLNKKVIMKLPIYFAKVNLARWLAT
jgi:hypothetical protein